MKKFKILLLSLLLLTGCSNEVYNDTMNEGKMAIANKEFDKAEAIFNLALEEKNNDNEATALLSQTEKIIDVINLKNEGNVVEAKKILEEILKIESKSDVVKKESNKLLEEINKTIEDIEINKKSIEDKITECENFIASGKYNDAKYILDGLSEQITNDINLNLYKDKVNELQNTCNIEIQNIKAQEEVKKQAEQQAEAEKVTKAEKNNIMYPMTQEKGRGILEENYPDYTYISDGEIIYDAFDYSTMTEAPAYTYIFENNIGEKYIGFVFKDGKYMLRFIEE